MERNGGHIQSDSIRGVDPLIRSREMIIARMAEYATGTGDTVIDADSAEQRMVAFMEALDIMTYASLGAHYTEEELSLSDLWRLGDPNYRLRIIREGALLNPQIRALCNRLRERLNG